MTLFWSPSNRQVSVSWTILSLKRRMWRERNNNPWLIHPIGWRWTWNAFVDRLLIDINWPPLIVRSNPLTFRSQSHAENEKYFGRFFLYFGIFRVSFEQQLGGRQKNDVFSTTFHLLVIDWCWNIFLDSLVQCLIRVLMALCDVKIGSIGPTHPT